MVIGELSNPHLPIQHCKCIANSSYHMFLASDQQSNYLGKERLYSEVR